MCCVCAQCRLPAGGGGCIAYALSKLRVFPNAKKAIAALDRASEKVLAARRVSEPDHPEVKVGTKSLTWCPEAIQRALQASRFNFTRVRLKNENQDSLEDFLQEGTFLDERILVEGTLAQRYLRQGTLHVNDPEDVHNGPLDPVWCHSVAVTGANLFDLYNPRGIHKSHLTQENKPYFLLIKKMWRITPFGEVRE